MASVDVGLQLVAAAGTGAVAILVATNAHAGRPRTYLVAFLLLLSLNHLAEAARGAGAIDPVLAFRIASVAAALDPLALALFVTSTHRLASGRPITLAALALGGGLALWAGWGPLEPGAPPAPFPIVLALFTAMSYGALLAALLMARHTDGVGIRGWLVAPLVVAVLPTLPRALDALLSPLQVSWIETPSLYAATLALRVLSVVTLAWLVDRSTRALSAEQRWLARLAVTLAVFLVALAELRNVVLAGAGFGLWGEPPSALAELGRGAAALRWLLFGALALGAIERAAPRPSARAARLVGRGVIGLTIFVLGSVMGLLLAAASGADIDLLSAPAAAVTLAVVLSQGFRRTVDTVTWRLTGHARAAEDGDLSIYRAAALQAVMQGRDPRRDPAVEAMRDRIRLSATDAEALAAGLEEAHAPELTEGAIACGRYRVDRSLGRGGQGRTFVARDLKLDRIVVLKELERSEAAGAEARAAAVVAHPNVVKVYDVTRRGGRGLIVMEFLEGGSLADRIRDGEPLRDPAAFAEKFVAALAAVHASGIVHGDVKPANLLLDGRGEPRLADFGLAGVHGQGTVTLASRAGKGTPRYMAPEIERGGPPSMRGDVYAAGLVLEAILGKAASPAHAAAIAKARAVDPEARFADAIEMQAAMRAYLQ